MTKYILFLYDFNIYNIDLLDHQQTPNKISIWTISSASYVAIGLVRIKTIGFTRRHWKRLDGAHLAGVVLTNPLSHSKAIIAMESQMITTA